MELALYCPDCGFYEKESDIIGRRGDFYTSVSVGGLFGELLAFQFAEWLTPFKDSNSPLKLVEAGAHDGRLARDILTWLQDRRPELYERLEHWIVEPSMRRRSQQEQTLREFGSRVCWAKEFGDVGKVTGVIYSNELLDAMPVQRFGWDANRQEWFEWGVAVEGESFVWKRLEGAIHDPQFATRVPRELLEVLPDGFVIESSPAADIWWRNAASALESGRLVTFDYGLTAEQFLLPERKDGTVRGYHRHRLVDDVLANPGEQDITAHVNFTAVQAVGETAGLKTETFQTQSQFLTAVAGRAWKQGSEFGEWTEAHGRQFQTLTHPNHLGRSFRVLVQSRRLEL